MRYVWIGLFALIGCEGDGLPGILGGGGPSGGPHPCAGSRTDTVWDDGDAFYVGCGTNAEGFGLYASPDGADWDEVPGTGGMRVSQVLRAADGSLVLAGTNSTSGDRVVRLEDSGALTPMFVSQGQLWNSFHVGSYAQTPAGLEVAESLTGYELAVRTGADWRTGEGWAGAQSHQILDMAVAGDRIVAVGSTIGEPPLVFVQSDAAGFQADTVQLAAWDGELWSVDADGDALVAGGVDQDADVGVVFTTDGDPRDPEAWRTTRLDALDLDIPDEPTWVRAVCRRGDHVVAAVEFTVRTDGMLLVSEDGGATWADRTPEDAPPLTACHLTDTTLAVAGADGWFGVWDR